MTYVLHYILKHWCDLLVQLSYVTLNISTATQPVWGAITPFWGHSAANVVFLG